MIYVGVFSFNLFWLPLPIADGNLALSWQPLRYPHRLDRW